MAAGLTIAAWTPLLHELVASELASEQAYKERIAQLVSVFRGDTSGGTPTPVVRLVEALGPFLTSESDAQRARATGVLAEVVEAAPASAGTAGEVRHLAHFFTARLTDWPAVRGALRGCLALVTRRAEQHPAGASAAAAASAAAQQVPAPEEADVVEMMRACVSNVFIRALAQADRTLALRLLSSAVRRYGTALVSANLDFLEYLISSVDGEKDPRCLLLSFEAVQAVVALYREQPEESLCRDRLEESAEELFEVLACYFPITFTPPPGDPNRITRDELAAGLQASLACEPLFAPHLVPLALEKLSSALRQAKLDSLALLSACAASWGSAPLASHASALWSALRIQLAAPAAEGVLPADAVAANEMADAAADCLARCVAAFQPGAGASEAPPGASLAGAVLADPSMQDMMACVREPGQDATRHRRSALRAQAGARAAQALCRAGGGAASKALSQLLPPLLAAVDGAAAAGAAKFGGQTQCLGWAVILDLLQAAAAAPAGGEAAVASSAALLREVVSAAAAALAVAAGEQLAAADAMDLDTAGLEAEEEDDSVEPASWPVALEDCTAQRAAALQLASLAAVFASPALAAALEPALVEQSVGSILQLLTAAGAPAAKQLQAAAVAPLAALASGCHADVLASSALPRLVAAAGQRQCAAAALAALQALAAASSGLQETIVGALDEAIAQQLPAAVQDSSCEALLLQLLRAAASIVAAAASAAEAAEEIPAAASFLRLGQHLLESATQLSGPAERVPSPALQSGCAELAYHAMRSGQAAQQQALGGAAAQALLQPDEELGPLQACVACALLVPLRQHAVHGMPGGQPAQLVQRLVQLALAQSQVGPLPRWASFAAASLLNKWTADAEALSSCASAVLQGQLYPACGLSPPEQGTGYDAVGSPGLPGDSPAAWGCLAGVSRGLAMRGKRQADAAVACAVASLDAAAQRWPAAGADSAADGLAAGVVAAARFLGSVLEGGDGGGRPSLSRQSFAVARPLWQQRLYTAAMGQLLPALQRSLAAGRVAGAAPRPPLAAPPLLLALAQLLQAVPAGVLQQDQRQLLPWLLQCLAALQGGPLGDAGLLQALLLLLSNALMSEAGRQQAEAELLPQLVPVLLDLAQYRHSAAVRETALQCLLLLLELPYTALHPYRRTVAHALAAAVDDSRRTVRLTAARVRQAWNAA